MPHIKTKPHNTTKNRKKSPKNKHAKLTKAQKRKAKVWFESGEHKTENWVEYSKLNSNDHKPKPIVTETVSHTGYSNNITIKNDDTDMIFQHVKINAVQHKIQAIHRLQDELMPTKIKQMVKSKIKPFAG